LGLVAMLLITLLVRRSCHFSQAQLGVRQLCQKLCAQLQKAKNRSSKCLDLSTAASSAAVSIRRPQRVMTKYCCSFARRYGSAGVLEQWIAEVERDVEELTDDTLSVGDIMDASLQR